MAQEQQQASPTDALAFLDNILSGVAGSRKDHIAIQGALGIVGLAITPRPDIAPPVADLEALASEQTPEE